MRKNIMIKGFILIVIIFIFAGSRYMGEMNVEKGDSENEKN